MTLTGKCIVDYPPDPSWALPEKLRAKGIELVPLTSGMAGYYVSIEYSSNALAVAGKTIPQANRLLVCFEPQAVHPAQFRRKNRSKFARTLVLSPLQRVLKTDLAFNAGFLGGMDVVVERIRKTSPSPNNRIAVVNQNKYSFVKGSTYKLRRDAIAELAEAGYEMHVGGKDWDSPLFRSIYAQAKVLILNAIQVAPLDLAKFSAPLPSNKNIYLHGEVPSNIGFMARHEFALIVENDPNYLSEKLFNAVLAGTIPVYFGANPKLFGIPEGIAVRVDGRKGSFAEALAGLSVQRRLEIFEAGTTWLSDPDTQKYWMHEQGLERLAKLIGEFISEETPAPVNETGANLKL